MSTEAKGIPTSAVPVNKPKAKSRPLTEEQKAIAEENLAQKASDMIREVDKAKLAEAKRATAEFKSARAAEKRAIDTLNSEEEAAEKYRRIQEARIKKKQESTASASGVKKSVKPGYLEHLTEDQFRTELSSEREAQEEEERRKAREQARTELEKERHEKLRKQQEESEKKKQELLRWKTEEQDRENLARAKRVSLQPASASVSPITAPGDVPIPGAPPEAFQEPISEEEASYRKELSERLAKLSDEVPESEKKRPKK